MKFIWLFHNIFVLRFGETKLWSFFFSRISILNQQKTLLSERKCHPEHILWTFLEPFSEINLLGMRIKKNQFFLERLKN